jgi:hypothetical protein
MQIGFLLEYTKMPDAPHVISSLTDHRLVGPATGATLLVTQWHGFDVNFIGIDGQNLVNF